MIYNCCLKIWIKDISWVVILVIGYCLGLIVYWFFLSFVEKVWFEKIWLWEEVVRESFVILCNNECCCILGFLYIVEIYELFLLMCIYS